MSTSSENNDSRVSRRRMLDSVGSGFGAFALSAMLARDGVLADEKSARGLHHAPKAKSVIQIFCPGGLSHVDTWDYKPVLAQKHGQTFDAELGKQTFAGVAGELNQSMWPFRQHGQSGLWLSDLFPQLAGCVDDLAFVYSMSGKSALHGPAMFSMSSGFARPGFPCMGSWVTYGLGSEADDLPSFVVLPDVRGLPPGGVLNWGPGFLPATFQGTVVETDKAKPPVADLFPSGERQSDEEAGRAFLAQLNSEHAHERPGDSLLEARIASYELAARLQLSAPEAVDLSQESAVKHQRFALNDPDIGPFGRQCLLARRFVERGVRYVQIYCGSENTGKKPIRPNWDSHEDLKRDHGYWGRILDTGAAALIGDLKERGLLDSTLVMCTTEFGRQPFMQGKQKGRDHNPGAFTLWMAGGGIQGGVGYGASDEIGFQAQDRITYVYDVHATALHLLGIDHTRLTFYHNGIARRLTDVHGHVIRDLLA
jgi:hypothetical protein